MKKIIMSAVILLASATMSMASSSRDDRPVTFEQLPQKAQKFIKEYFPENKISFAKQDREMFDGDFEVIFTDGKKLEFDKKGEWKNVKCKQTEVPTGIIPTAIKAFITEKHPDLKIISIDRDTRDYEVKLSNGMELKFNLKGKFLSYDL